VLKRIFEPRRNEVTRGWIKLHNEELHYFYSAPNVIIMMTSRRRRWAGNVALMGEKGTHIDFGGKARRKETTKSKT
jgi:hypothetical protein